MAKCGALTGSAVKGLSLVSAALDMLLSLFLSSFFYSTFPPKFALTSLFLFDSTQCAEWSPLVIDYVHRQSDLLSNISRDGRRYATAASYL